jgi:hypothetical protein
MAQLFSITTEQIMKMTEIKRVHLLEPKEIRLKHQQGKVQTRILSTMLELQFQRKSQLLHRINQFSQGKRAKSLTTASLNSHLLPRLVIHQRIQTR